MAYVTDRTPDASEPADAITLTSAPGKLRDCIPLGAAGLLLVLALLLRLLLISQAPFTDEGCYLAIAFHMWHDGPGLPAPLCEMGNINLIPFLLSWLFSYTDNPLIAFRAADAVAVGTCVVLVFLVSRRFAPGPSAWVLSALWLASYSHPLFVNAGFKNMLSFGLAAVLAGILVITGGAQRWRSWIAGSFAAVACLCREPLLVFILPVMMYAFARFSWTRALEVGLAFLLSGLLGVTVIGITQGVDPITGWLSLLANARDTAGLFARLVEVEGIDLRAHALSQFRDAMDVVLWVVPVWSVGVLLAFVRAFRQSDCRPALLAAAVMPIVPLPEFLLKLGFPYHVSVTFLGLTLMSAIGWGYFRLVRWSWVPIVIVVSISALFTPAVTTAKSITAWYAGLRHAWVSGKHFAPFVLEQDWSSPVVEDSFYLHAASVIRTISKPDDRILVSGFYAVLYPLSGRRPVTMRLSDLTGTWLIGGPGEADRRLLHEHPPMLFVETSRFTAMDLKSCFDGFADLYEEVAFIDVGKPHYGHYGCRIYRLREAAR